MKPLIEALINKSNIKNVKRKEKLWILVPDGENPLIADAEYDDCSNLSKNSYYMYVLTNEQIKDIFDRYPNWYDVIIYDYKGNLDKVELLDEIPESYLYSGKKFLGCDSIDIEKLLKLVK